MNMKRNLLLLFFMISFGFIISCDHSSATSESLDADEEALTIPISESAGLIPDVPVESNVDCYTATTEDNVELKLRRFRPATDAKFNVNGQPVLLIPGVGTNMNEFLPQTTEQMKDVYAKMELPETLPAWAVGDEYIQNDHLLLYNIGYFLWKQGYDVWFANNRGTGRGEYKSQNGINKTNIDVFGCLDVPAMVSKITGVTGLKPIIGGHSNGAAACYIYLQGCYMDIDEVMKGKTAYPAYLPHVKMSLKLAAERNSSVKGFIGMDPGTIPILPESLNVKTIWKIIRTPTVLPVDTMMETMLVKSGWTTTLIGDTIGLVFNVLTDMVLYYPVLEPLDFWHTDNVDRYVLDHYMRYGTGNGYLRIFAQYFDWGMNHVLREGYTNGVENKDLVVAEPKKNGDGYYYYEDHMDNITTPTVIFASDAEGLSDTETVRKYIYNRKTRHSFDMFAEIPDTGHADQPNGIQAPTIMFPMLDKWLKQF